MAYEKRKDLPRRTASDNVLHDKAFNIAKIQYMMDVKEVLLQWFMNFLIERFLAQELKVKLRQTSS